MAQRVLSECLFCRTPELRPWRKPCRSRPVPAWTMRSTCSHPRSDPWPWICSIPLPSVFQSWSAILAVSDFCLPDTVNTSGGLLLNPHCFVCCFQMTLIRSDMKTVQDRLLTQMVSGYDRFDLSAFELHTFLLFLNTTVNGIWSSGVNVIKPCVLALPSCSMKVSCRLWRGVCMSCFSPDPQVSIWGPMKGTHSVHKDFLLTTFVFIDFISQCLPGVLICPGPALNPLECVVYGDLNKLFLCFTEKCWCNSLNMLIVWFIYLFNTQITCFWCNVFTVTLMHLRILWFAICSWVELSFKTDYLKCLCMNGF